MNVDRAINIEHLRQLARTRLPRIIYDYLDGGAEDEVTIARNRASFEEIALIPRVVAGHKKANLETSLFGNRLSLPFVIGPTGLNGIFRRNADIMLAHAARKAGAAFVLATAANNSIETVGAETDGVKWFQFYPWGDKPMWQRLLERASAAGFTALVVTVDTPVAGNRERDRRNRFAHDVTYTPSVILDGALHPGWVLDVWFGGLPRFENFVEFVSPNAGAHELATFTRKHRHPELSWDDLITLRGLWKGPFIIKGILATEDAKRALSIGADGVVVSNHGGRQLDGAVSTMRALPGIVDAVGEHMVVLVDGGLRRGSDVVKALSLGAKAVVLGRAPLYGVAAAGEAGVSRALQILTDEMSKVMTLIGCGSVENLSRSYLQV